MSGIVMQGRVTAQKQLPPLLLLHGHPQTHVIWHRVAPQLAQHFSLVMPDLRGYGDSSKPPSDAHHATYSKRAMAHDLRALMAQLGYERFQVLAHDRGARVAHRLAVDYPEAVERMLLLDIAPTLAMYEQTSQAFATAYWHWFFLIQAAPFPENLINANPLAYLRKTMRAAVGEFDPHAWAEYERCIQNPETVRAICEDYRAAASIDLEHARADIARQRWIECPLHVLWGKQGVIQQCFDPLAEWRKLCRQPTQVTGGAIDCGHYIPEESPQRLVDAALQFFTHSR
ncbi:alpha/beta fold hydrolase [Parvibium lacunae]|uniref:Alpha/beta hydrolase n=1 Tax=Parvibium lacunae TaxID=1888893 RepID=A0A368KZW2_9BURK|nr:alpha/beta hydrolase [Parvibium lacunae]RCS56682.1 alpha/beta hydrolase [Parvibium lacunae]